jgi:mersacidin/lichenicidin family type 2 lantibiotic
MSQNEIIRAWKDADYRNGLSDEQRNHLPENPAGALALSDTEMEALAGGCPPVVFPPRPPMTGICGHDL